MRPPSDEPPSFCGGDAFRFVGRRMDKHPWVVLSSPLEDGDHVLIVNFTTWRQWEDQTCVVDPAECPQVLTSRSCLKYSGCQVWRLGVLESKEDYGEIERLGNVGPDVLHRMRQGVIDSPQAPYEAKDILISQGLVTD